jgi:ABC-type multidrug transport system fused ATPase/permease subunit
MLDEATASCDVQTDAMVQGVIRRVFADCTVLTVAHRLHTIADSDRIMVLAEGQIVEFDAPSVLLKQPGSHYRGLVEESTSHRLPDSSPKAGSI